MAFNFSHDYNENSRDRIMLVLVGYVLLKHGFDFGLIKWLYIPT